MQALSPAFPDQGKTNEAEIIFGIVPLLVGLLLLLCASFWIPGFSPKPAPATVLVLIFAALMAVALPMARAGRVALASYWTVGLLLLLCATSIALFGGVTGAVMLGLSLVVVLGAALRGREGVVVTAIVVCLATTVLWALEARGVTPVIVKELDLGGTWISAMFMIAMCAVGLRHFAARLDTAKTTADMSRQRAELSASQLRDYVRQSPDGIAFVDERGALLACNPAYEQITGHSVYDLHDMLVTEQPHIGDEEARETLARAIARAVAGEEVFVESRWRRGGDEQVAIEANIKRVLHVDGSASVQVVVRDVTEKLRAATLHQEFSARQHEAERLESIGQLAGGVAHDFRNLLTAVIANADLALHHPQLPEETREELRQIVLAGERATALTQQLLTFARRQESNACLLDLAEVVGELEPLLQRLIREDIELVVAAGAGSATVLADPSQMEQLVVNLVVNARDAMPSGGRVTVETLCMKLDDDGVRTHPGLEPGEYVTLVVTDSGEGMDSETLERVFEPFYTTKAVGEGTGLGLATVHGIVAQSGGTITVYSEPGRGASFRVYLPRAEGVPVRARQSIPKTSSANGKATILVADDEPLVRDVGCRVLRAKGFHVLEAHDGADGARVGESHSGEIHLLITDVVMPGLTGPQLAKRLRKRYPELAVLYVSGYTEGAAVQNSELDAGVVFLPKPFTIVTLLDGVKRALAVRS